MFILSLKWLSHPRTARRGVRAGEIGMALAVIGTLMMFHVVDYTWVLIGIVIGSLIGAPMAIWMPMTAVPQRTALSHAFGALAAALVGIAHYYEPHGITIDRFTMGVLAIEVLLGSLTFTGSLVAFGKLQELIPSSIKGLPNQNIINFALLGAAILCGIWLIFNPDHYVVFLLLVLLGLAFGLCLVMPIGGADMPTVISLLNSYAGLSASMMGFVLDNYLLIIAGALDGSSGLILSIIMCKAMNRSFTNVLFGRMDASQVASADDVYGGKVKSASAEDVAMMLDGAQRVVVVPGYGMAVAQAQHAVRELFNMLEGRGTDVEIRDSSRGRPHAGSNTFFFFFLCPSTRSAYCYGEADARRPRQARHDPHRRGPAGVVDQDRRGSEAGRGARGRGQQAGVHPRRRG